MRSEKSKKQQREYANEYTSKHYERINSTYPIGTKEKFKKIAREQGLSVSQMILQAVKEYANKRGLEL